MGLTFVPTPLGNLRDITLRALDVLRDCELVVAEDTRVARRLLSAHGISGKQLWSYREQNAAAVTEAILERAGRGPVAVLSDAGTPGISDPGRELVAAARAAGVAVEVLPGAAAFVVAAVLSGFALEPLVFAGFVPRKNEREAALSAALGRRGTTVFYESSHRIAATLDALAALDANARVFVARELTKLHEQQLLGTPAEVSRGLERPIRGELALVIEGAAESARSAVNPDALVALDADIEAALAAGQSVAAAAKSLAGQHGLARNAIYARIMKRKSARERLEPS